MIVNDFPALSCLSKDQSESAMRLVVGSFKMPAAQENPCVISNRGDLKSRKGQRTHLLARVVVSLVTVQHGLPAAVDVIAGNEHRVFGAGIAIHVAFNISAIPGVSLRVEHGANGRDDPGFAFVWLCGALGLYRQWNDRDQQKHSREQVTPHRICWSFRFSLMLSGRRL